jgi:hypothetical protein
MLLKVFYYSVSFTLLLPYVAWIALVSITMWDSKYWDGAMSGLFQAIDSVNENN